jgi:hypothetical protein
LRESLLARTPDPDLVAKLKALCDEIVHRVENTQEDCSALLDEIGQLSGCRFDETYFRTLYGWASHDDFARLVALGSPPRVEDITRDELIEVVTLILSSPFPLRDYYVALFNRNVTHPAGSDLIFWPQNHWPAGYEPTAEEIVDKATDPGNVIRL